MIDIKGMAAAILLAATAALACEASEPIEVREQSLALDSPWPPEWEGKSRWSGKAASGACCTPTPGTAGGELASVFKVPQAKAAAPPIEPARDQSLQILFTGWSGVAIECGDRDTKTPLPAQAIVVPGRQNFPEGGLYRLRVSRLAKQERQEIAATLELARITPRTETYLDQNAIPVSLTEKDLAAALAGQFLTNVVILVDPEFQAAIGQPVETIHSALLEPGRDPIAEADRRGSILAILRIGPAK